MPHTLSRAGSESPTRSARRLRAPCRGRSRHRSRTACRPRSGRCVPRCVERNAAISGPNGHSHYRDHRIPRGADVDEGHGGRFTKQLVVARPAFLDGYHTALRRVSFSPAPTGGVGDLLEVDAGRRCRWWLCNAGLAVRGPSRSVSRRVARARLAVVGHLLFRDTGDGLADHGQGAQGGPLPQSQAGGSERDGCAKPALSTRCWQSSCA